MVREVVRDRLTEVPELFLTKCGLMPHTFLYGFSPFLRLFCTKVGAT